MQEDDVFYELRRYLKKQDPRAYVEYPHNSKDVWQLFMQVNRSLPPRERYHATRDGMETGPKAGGRTTFIQPSVDVASQVVVVAKDQRERGMSGRKTAMCATGPSQVSPPEHHHEPSGTPSVVAAA